MKKERKFAQSDRYTYDFGVCSAEKGYCQVDTSQDAAYFGIWTNPHERKIVTYCEGDLIIETAENDKEYVEAIQNLKAWHDSMKRCMKIDAYTQPAQRARLESLGLGDLLH